MPGTDLGAGGTAVSKTDVCPHREIDDLDLDLYTYVFQHIVCQYVVCQIVIKEEVLLEW